MWFFLVIYLYFSYFPEGFKAPSSCQLPASTAAQHRSILLPQNEQFYVTDSLWVNLDNVLPAHWKRWNQALERPHPTAESWPLSKAAVGFESKSSRLTMLMLPSGDLA